MAVDAHTRLTTGAPVGKGGGGGGRGQGAWRVNRAFGKT